MTIPEYDVCDFCGNEIHSDDMDLCEDCECDMCAICVGTHDCEDTEGSWDIDIQRSTIEKD